MLHYAMTVATDKDFPKIEQLAKRLSLATNIAGGMLISNGVLTLYTESQMPALLAAGQGANGIVLGDGEVGGDIGGNLVQLLLLVAVNRVLVNPNLQIFDDVPNGTSLPVTRTSSWMEAAKFCGFSVDEAARELADVYGLVVNFTRLIDSNIPNMSF